MGLCMFCMGEMEPGQRICQHCGQDGSRIVQPDYVLPPGTFLHDGKYLIGRVLGQGGFGITYIGFDMVLHTKVAVKEYYPRSMASRTTGSTSLFWHTTAAEQKAGRETFIKEAQKMAKVQNTIDSVSRVQEIFYQNQTAYIIMNYIEGDTLKQYLDKHGVTGERECVSLFKPVMDALGQAHRSEFRLIHRDISPDNIMIDKNGKVWLLDLGAAKELSGGQSAPNLSQSTRMVVRNGFSPLEQYTDSGKIGPWTDVYAVCAAMYYCMTGRLVPDAPSRVYQPNLEIKGLSSKLTPVLKRGLALNPEDRYQSMEELERWVLGAVPISSASTGLLSDSPLPGTYRKPERKKKAAGLKAAIAAAVLLLVCLAGLLIWKLAFNQPGSGGGPDPLSIETLGTSSANMLNFGTWAEIENKYEYFIAADHGLYVCQYNMDDKTYDRSSAEKICNNAEQITIGGSYVYFAANPDCEYESIYRMNQDGTGMKPVVTADKQSLDYWYLNFVQLYDGSQFLYYCLENDPDNASYALRRYNLRSRKEEVLMDEIFSYSLCQDSIYFIQQTGDWSATRLCRADLDGQNIQELNTDKFILSCVPAALEEQELLITYSQSERTILFFNLDGTPSSEYKPLYDLDIYNECLFGYENGWIYYNRKSEESIHRIRLNGKGDAVVMEGCRFEFLCSEDNTLWFLGVSDTNRPRQIKKQTFLSWKGSDSISEVQDPKMTWDLPTLDPMYFEWEEAEDENGVVITGYTGGAVRFSIPEQINGEPVVRIGEEAFQESAIEEIGLPDSVHTLDDSAFYGCESLEFIGLPDHLKVIGISALADCTALKEIDLPDSLERIRGLALAGTMISSICVPKNLNSIGHGAFAVKSSAQLKEFTVSSGNTFLTAIDGVLYYTKEMTLIAYPSGRTGGYTIEDGTVRIYESAFRWCKGLTNLTIPESVTQIDEDAFKGTSLTAITINRECQLPENLKDLGIENLTINYYS